MAVQFNVRCFLQARVISCWWACIRMILAYHGRQTPDNPGDFREQLAPPLYSARPRPMHYRQRDSHEWYRVGVIPERIPQLAQIVGFSMYSATPPTWTPATLEATLRELGPFAYLARFPGGNHVFVVTGASDQSVTVNDPTRGPNQSHDYQWLAEKSRSLRTSAVANPQGLPVLYFAGRRGPRAQTAR